MSRIRAITGEGRTIAACYGDLSRLQMSLRASRRARAIYHERHGGTIPEAMLFRIIEEQRRIAHTARQQTLSARLEGERRTRLSSDRPKRDRSREMFAIDTGNPDLPTCPMDDFGGSRRKT